MINKFRCKHCKKIITRNSDKKRIVSYCLKADRHVQLVNIYNKKAE